jgi:hypothetical protein
LVSATECSEGKHFLDFAELRVRRGSRDRQQQTATDEAAINYAAARCIGPRDAKAWRH